jgi:hypothetical protein
MNYSIEIASVIDREDLVAEIWIDETMFAEINQLPNGKFGIEIYHKDQESWSLDLMDLQDILHQAKLKLNPA